MKEGINDKVLAKMLDLQHRSIAKIGEITKGDKPFASQEIKWSEINNALDSISPMDMSSLVNEYGFELVNNLIGQARMNDRRKRNG